MTMFSDSLRAFLKPVVAFLDDPDISEILINGPAEVWIERKGKLRRTRATFTEEGLLAAARNMAQYVGRQLSEERPRLDARLPDGSRIHVVLPPIARRGTTISIRKFFAEKLTPAHLVQFGSVSAAMARFLEAVIALRINVVIAGGTGSGKTSLLNALSTFIAADERILTIEDSAELQLPQPHIVTLESRPADRQGKGEIGIGDLLNSALRLRPDRIIVGEVRGGECFHLLQAMNTGHGGSLTTAHANTPTDTLRRLESLCLLSGIELPLRAVRAQVASAIQIVICCERMADGTRKLTNISEVLPLDDRGEYRVQDLFVYTQTGRGPEGEVLGFHAPTGLLPLLFPKLLAAGFNDLDAAFFDPPAQGLPTPPQFTADLGERSRWAKKVREATDPDARAPANPDGRAPAQAKPLLPSHKPEIATSVTGPIPRAARWSEAFAAPGSRAASTRTPVPPLSGPPDRPPSPVSTAVIPVAPIVPVAPAAPLASVVGLEAPVPAAVAVRAPEAPADSDQPSIQLDPGMAAEVALRLPYESTLITRNPLLDSRSDEETRPAGRNPPRR